MHKNQVFLNKKTSKICYRDGTIDNKPNIYRDKRLQKNISLGLEPEKVENHCSKVSFPSFTSIKEELKMFSTRFRSKMTIQREPISSCKNPTL